MFRVWLFINFQVLLGFAQFLNFNPDLKTAKPLKILVISDLNASYGSTHYSEEVIKVISKIDSIKPDLILCAGDMVAGQKLTLTKTQTEAMWQAFNDKIFEPISQQKIPFGFTIGNHDGSPNFKQDREVASAYWEKQKSATNLNFISSEHFPYYYSYMQNNVFIISWDASGAIIKEEVYSWMENELKSPLAKKATMRILLGHLPLYAIVDSKNKPGEVNSNPEAALNFFKKYNINLYISGHQHAYFPAQKDGIYFLNAGAIGDGPRTLIDHNAAAFKAYSILEIPAKAKKMFGLTTWNPSTEQPVLLEELPLTINGFNGVSTRIKN